MFRQLLGQLLKSKLAMTDHIISILPDNARQNAEKLRRIALLAFREAADTYLQENLDDKKPDSECTAIRVD